jgi:hypothetical protein
MNKHPHQTSTSMIFWIVGGLAVVSLVGCGCAGVLGLGGLFMAFESAPVFVEDVGAPAPYKVETNLEEGPERTFVPSEAMDSETTTEESPDFGESRGDVEAPTEVESSEP